MPLFGRSSNTAAPAQTTTTTTQPQKHGLFHKNEQTTNNHHHNNNNNTVAAAPAQKHGLFHRNTHEDPSIVAARERVLSAEAAERDADRALGQARIAVREAREGVRRLEREAAEEARLAKVKQSQAKSIGNRSSHLGRHGI